MIVYSSITLNYLPKARVLSNTLKKYHPDWSLHLVISDKLTESETRSFEEKNASYFDEFFWIKDLEIENKQAWIFSHDIVELCTAVKGPYLDKLVKEGANKIAYIDPDIAIFNNLLHIDKLLDNHAILLIPHLLERSNDPQAIADNEIAGALRHGIFNLGFLAINAKHQEGKQFSEWWDHRLSNYCFADYEKGLFTDQKWCDLVPAFFEDFYIIRDPGYDVASWNINTRNLCFSHEGRIYVNDYYPLRFYHFTGYDSGAGNIMTQRYSKGSSIVQEIWSWYNREVKRMGQSKWGTRKCYYDYFNNGKLIPPEIRKMYRDNTHFQEKYPNPYDASISKFVRKGGIK